MGCLKRLGASVSPAACSVPREGEEPAGRPHVVMDGFPLSYGSFHHGRSDHFVVAVQHCRQDESLAQSLADWALEVLEATYSEFHRSFEGWDLTHAKDLLVVIFTECREFKKHNARTGIASQLHGQHSGHFCRRANQVALLLEPSVPDPGDGRQCRIPSTRHWLEIRRCNLIHEASHLISFNCGLLSREVEYPWWVVEGLAVCFEVTPPGESPFCGSRIATGAVLHHLVSLDKSRGLLSLADFSRLVRPPWHMPGLTGWKLMYCQGWAMFLLIFRCYPSQLAKLLADLKRESAGKTGCFASGPLIPSKSAIRSRQLRQCFGDLSELEGYWMAFLHSIQHADSQ